MNRKGLILYHLFIHVSNYLLTLLSKNSLDYAQVCLDHAPKNDSMISPDVQKDIVSSMASNVLEAIVREIDNGYFCVLVDECRDESVKEQMSLVIRFVDKKGLIQERFLDMIHVADTRSESLREALVKTLNRNGLSTDKIRGQGYDGASNMRGELNGLKSLILKTNPSAFFVHCFAHRLQLVLMSAAKTHVKVCRFFNEVAAICVATGSSCIRSYQLKESQVKALLQDIDSEDIETGRGLNQICSLRRPGDTRWASHCITLCRILKLYASIMEVLGKVVEDGANDKSRGEASRLLDTVMCCFEFAFFLHLMKDILTKSQDLSHALQRKDKDILNATDLVAILKLRLKEMRTILGFQTLIEQIQAFCSTHEIEFPAMDSIYVHPGRPRRNVAPCITEHYYCVEFFYKVIDSQLYELEDRFPKQSSLLLKRIAYFSSMHLLTLDAITKLSLMATMYPNYFSTYELMILEEQLKNFVLDFKINSKMQEIQSLTELSVAMVQLNKSITYPLVFRLMRLVLTLPISTASIERTFSKLKFVKNKIQNSIGDEFLSNAIILFIEKDLAQKVTTECVIENFKTMSTRRSQFS